MKGPQTLGDLAIRARALVNRGNANPFVLTETTGSELLSTVALIPFIAGDAWSTDAQELLSDFLRWYHDGGPLW